MFIYRFYILFTNKPNENNELKPITTVAIDHVLPKNDLEIEHVLIGVEKNRSRLYMTHVPKVGSDFRLRKSTPVFDPVCLQPKRRTDGQTPRITFAASVRPCVCQQRRRHGVTAAIAVDVVAVRVCPSVCPSVS